MVVHLVPAAWMLYVPWCTCVCVCVCVCARACLCVGVGVGSIGGGACELWGRGGLCTVYFLEGGAHKNLWVLGKAPPGNF